MILIYQEDIPTEAGYFKCESEEPILLTRVLLLKRVK